MPAPPLDADQIEHRLTAFYDDLAQFPAGAACPWPLGRVFNELLKQVKLQLSDDPLVGSIAYARESAEDDGYASAQIGTLRTLAGQLIAAIGSPGSTSAASPPRERAAEPAA